ncbi:MAG: ABC transporter permease [Acidobacteriaceae bacterium]|nr:ABC transporter permease [Acidobacteriaceae bacterium]MBV9778361.1 ABC transporter permease [Acidobacteriaceae bacterium]
MRFFTKLFRPARIDYDLEEELHSHIQHRADDLERSGLNRIDAERRARIEFGGHVRFKEESREALGGNFIETLAQDLRFSIRVLRKSPGFTIAAVITLALAIGANAVVFGVLNALILRPLNVPQAQSLYGIERGSDKSVNQSYPDYLDLRDRNRSFEDLAAYNVSAVGIDTGNNPSSSWIMEVTANYFDALSIQPYLGRFFHASDEHGPNSAPYIVLTHAYWHSHFRDDRGVVGRVVQINKHPFTIIGVAPPEFRGTLLFVFPDFWVPIVNQEQVEGSYVLAARGTRGILMVLGHLKPGITPAQAVADLNSIGSYLERTYPKEDGHMTFSLARPGLAGDWLGSPVRAFLTALMLLAGLILLAACANLGSLFAARAFDRSREVALRLALGSGRARILRQLFTEAMLVSLIGGAAGLWGSVLLLNALSVWEPLPTAPLQVPVYPDANVYGMALLLALFSGFLFGAVPVKQVLRTDPYQVIKSGSTGRIRRRLTVRDVLLVVQIAICAVLVTSSLVSLRGLARSLYGNFGFEPQNTVLVETALNMAGYSGHKVPEMQKRMINALKDIPGVESVGLIDRLPLYYGANSSTVFRDQTGDLRPSNAAAEAMLYNISPEYFTAARTPLLAGRALSWRDDTNAPRVAVVNQEFARKVLGSVSDAIGRRFKMPEGTRVEVVGLVVDGKYASLAEDPQPAMFLPILQSPANQMSLVVRSKSDSQQLTAAIKNTMRRLDAGLPFTIRAWSQELESALFPSRIATLSLGVLGIMGAMLSITGIFGMAAYSVSKRLKELGIRMALGARRKEVLQAALGRAFRLLAFGSAAGLVLGILASRVLAAIVYQATPRDPLVLAGVIVAMAFIGLLAAWVPAQRALSLDPSTLLREE